jgi:5,5'-dehydrodivanillate O-demethylase
MNQDFVGWVGQGTIADRTRENLRSSDVGITMMRQRFFAELEAVAAGRDPKGIMRERAAAQSIALPDMGRETNTQGIALEDFEKDPVLRQQLKGFRHLYGQPPDVRRAFEEAMGIGRKE